MGLNSSEWDVGTMSRFCALKINVKDYTWLWGSNGLKP